MTKLPERMDARDSGLGTRDSMAGTRGSMFRGAQRSLRALFVSLALVLLAFAAPLAAIEPLEFKDRAEEQRYQKLLRELRCLQCQNQSLADSDANVAGGLRQEIHRQMQAGKSDEEIKAFLVERYGEFVLYRPEVKGGTMLLWFGPFVILALGGAALLVHLRRRAAAAPAAPVAASASNRSEEDW
jgi:cytochrome c-type biogenesis protein CcmH